MSNTEAKQGKHSRIASFFIYAAGPLLVAYLLLLLGTTYISQKDLREASARTQLLNLENRAAALSYFHSERRSDITTLVTDRTLGVFFSNRDLGMSMVYGLRASLLSMQKQFQDLVDSKLIDSSPIYLRLLFLDNQGEKLVDVGVAKNIHEPWIDDELLAAKEIKLSVIQSNEHSHMVLSSPYYFKGKRMGAIIAEINLNEVLRQLIQPKMTNHTPYKVLIDGSEYTFRYSHTDKRQSTPPRIPEQSSSKFASYMKVPVPGTSLVLAARHPEGTSSDLLTSPWYLFSLALLALLVLSTVVIGVRTRMRNLLLHASVEESERSGLLLKEQNVLLEEEARKRHESETHLQTLIETIPDLVWAKDPDGVYLACNPKFERFFGAREEEIIGKTDYDFVASESADFFRQHDKIAMDAGKPSINEELVTYADDGHEELLETIKTPMRDSEGQLVGVLGIARDITERKHIESKLRTLSQAIEQSPVSVVITDPKANIQYVNSAFEQLTGYSSAEAVGENPRMLKSGNTPREIYRELWQTITSGRTWQGEIQNRRKNGELFWEHANIAPVLDEAGKTLHYLAVKEDITLRKQQEKHILHQAHFDSLTDLPNRFLSLDRLSQLLSEAQRNRERVAVLFLDLDDFKKINDTLGHDTGDKLLIEAASRLRSVIRGGDTVGRLGGDEFIVLLGGLEDAADVSPVVENLLYSFRDPFRIDGRELVLTTSAGVAVYPDDGDNPSELLRNADSAMYHSKEQGRNTYSYFTDAMNQEVSRRLHLEEQMHGALDRGEFRLCYQPQVDVGTRMIIGVEALLRWNNPALGDVSPTEFIPITEQTGLIIPIGQFVLSQALTMAAKWQQKLGRRFTMAVNLSPSQFRDPNLVPLIEKTILQTGLTDNSLELEITEGVLMSGHAYIDEALAALSDLGVGIAMDDFGTGYSSLSYLRSYPFDILKIDRSFINDITVDKADLELVNASIAMAHGLGLKIVAEGVETEEQLAHLANRGCEYAQGYLFCKPVSAEEITAMLESEDSALPAV